MSKRGADEYITKENGSTPNSASDGSKVKMATAAQLAKRKMAVPKSRSARSGNSPLPGAGPNPFGGTNTFAATQSNQTQSFSAPGGISFGASQSFPSGDQNSASGFTFSVPGQSSSFTFGQPAPNNPFATLNGNTGDHLSQDQDSNDITMESPQKKPAFGSNMFGSSNGQNNASPTGFSFGQPASQAPSQPSFAFAQTSGSGNASSTPLFGQIPSKPTESNVPANGFGQSLSTQTNGTPAFGGFGQKPDEKKQETKPPGFTFGQRVESTPSPAPTAFGQSTSSAPASTPAFSFGQSAAQAPSSTQLFGGSSSSSQPAFGAVTSNSQPATGGLVFDSAAAGSSSNPFSALGGFKPAESKATASAPSSDTSKLSMFGQPSPASNQPDSASTATTQPKTNPFAGLFGQSVQSQSQPTAPSAADASKSSFNFAASAQPSGLFSAPKSPSEGPTSKPVGDTPKKPLFSFGTPTATPSSTLFSSAATEGSTPANPFAALSAQKHEHTDKEREQPSSNQQTVFPPSPAFGSTSSSTALQAATTPSQPKVFDGFGGFASTSSSSPSTQGSPVVESATTKHASAMSSAKASTPSLPAINPASRTMSSTTTAPVVGSSPANTNEDLVAPRRTVNTHPPARIPPYLNGDDYKAYDSNYRLHSLNREFQKRVRSLDPSRDDFENLVRNYVAARESIGESIGLYTRSIAGTKRKADDSDDRRSEDPASTKRNKPATEPSLNPLLSSSSASSSVFQPVPPSSRPSAPSIHSSPAKTASSAPTTSSLFSSMIPNNITPSAAPSNPFAALPKSPNHSAIENPQEATFMFGNAGAIPTAESTTPTKSPPKKAAFELPKFAAPSGGMNFMAAFQKGSAASAAKLAKEAMEKRKAEEFDSDEDDEEEWTRKYEEEERAKKAKLDAVAQTGFKPTFANAKSSAKPLFSFGASATPSAPTFKPSLGFGSGNPDAGTQFEKQVDVSDNDTAADDDDEEDDSAETGDGEGDDADGEEEEEAEEDDLPEDEINGADEHDDEDLETAMANSRANGKSLFDRITPNPSLQKGPTSVANAVPSIEKDTAKQPFGFNNTFGKATAEAPSLPPLTPAGAKEPYVPAKTFNFTPTPPGTTPTPAHGASIFAGGAVKNGPIAGEGLFGSRPSTPSNADQPKSSVFGGLGTPSFGGPTDNTWKKGSEIKFGASTTDAPSLSITEPTPRKDESKPFANLFGANHTGMNSSSNPGVGFSFGQSSPAPGFLSAAAHLAGGSGTNSGFSSRATSPGTTDNESIATNEEDFSNDAQVSLLETHPGEEHEEVISEMRVKAMRYYNADQIKGTKLVVGWNAYGLGPARLLKHRETGKTRIVMRAEPGANILLNANLQPNFKYDYVPGKTGGTVKFNVVAKEGLQGWIFKTKTSEQAQEFAKLMEANKTASASS